MKSPRRAAVISTSVALGWTSLLTAAPATAAATPTSITESTCNPTAPSATVSATTVSWTSASDTLSVTNDCSVGGDSMAIRVVILRGTSLILISLIANGTSSATSALTSDVSEIRIYQTLGPTNLALLATLTAFSPSSGGGGGGSSNPRTPQPQIFELTLTPDDGTPCTNSAHSGASGTWLTLPGVSEGTPPASRAGAILLGRDTTPNFPVAIARRQVGNS